MADENFGSIRVKSGVNEFQADLSSFAALPDPGSRIILFIVSMSFLELTGVLVNMLYIVAPNE